MHLLHRVTAYAGMYYTAYAWTSPHFSFLDLVQAGNMAILENIDRVLQSDHTNPYAYLTVAAYQAIRHYSKRYNSLIITPHTADVNLHPVASLDAPLDSDSGGTLYDLVADELEEPANVEPEDQEPPDYTPLYEALDKLGKVGRTVIVHHYGLFDQAPMSLHYINRDIIKRQGASTE